MPPVGREQMRMRKEESLRLRRTIHEAFFKKVSRSVASVLVIGFRFVL